MARYTGPNNKQSRRLNFSVLESGKEFAKGKTYFIHTYGCQANYRDEEEMAGLLALAGYTKANAIEEADFILLNTCAVRENAEQKVFGQIGNLKAVKAKISSNMIPSSAMAVT